MMRDPVEYIVFMALVVFAAGVAYLLGGPVAAVIVGAIVLFSARGQVVVAW